MYIGALSSINFYALGVGIGTLTLIVALRRFAPQLPAFLIALLMACLAVALLHLPLVTVGDRFPSMPSGIPAPQIPHVSLALLQQLWPSAFTIAFLAGLESLLSATVADGMTGYSHRQGQELVAQGVANMASALFGGLPATGAIARTATNIRAGARSPLAGMFHAVFLLLLLLIAGRLIALVPMAALAAILLVVAWGMSEAERFKSLLKMDAGERAILLLTFGLTVLVDLTVAIGVGVTLASLLFLARMSATAGLLPAELSVDDPAQRAALPKGVEVFRFAGPMFFGVAREMLIALRHSGRKPRSIILRMDQVPYIDSSGASALEAFVQQAAREGTQIIVCDLRAQPAAFLAKLGPHFSGATRTATFQSALDQLNSSPSEAT
jgi:sulfate permease, SulP family